jgi:hypothetical protein
VEYFYTEGNYTWPLTDKLGLKLKGQFTEQGSVGGDNLIGSFHTRVGGKYGQDLHYLSGE